MCGIGGVIKIGKLPILEEQIAALLVGNEHRGNDAAGFVIQQADGTLSVFKRDTQAWTLVTSADYEAFIEKELKPDSHAVLVHTRGASQGTPRINTNNHPMYANLSAIVHNGVIRNDSQMFGQLKLDRKAETDSDIIRAVVDKEGITTDAILTMGKFTGSGAIAAVHPGFPGKVMIVRSGNPLTLASNDDFLFFSSEKTTLHKVCRPFIERMGIWFQAQSPNIDFSTMPDNTGWIIGPKGLEAKAECKICTGNYSEPWRKTYEEFNKRQEKWNNSFTPQRAVAEGAAEGVHMGVCLGCERDWIIPKDEDPSKFFCNKKFGGCGAALWPKPSKKVHVMGERVN